MRTLAFNEGQLAAQNGRELFENPYSSPESSRTAFMEWFAGWCCGHRELAKKWALATHSPKGAQ